MVRVRQNQCDCSVAFVFLCAKFVFCLFCLWNCTIFKLYTKITLLVDHKFGVLTLNL